MKNLTRLLAISAASVVLTSCTPEELALMDATTSIAAVAGEADANRSFRRGDYDCAERKINFARQAYAFNQSLNRYADRSLSRDNNQAMANAIQNRQPEVVVINQAQQQPQQFIQYQQQNDQPRSMGKYGCNFTRVWAEYDAIENGEKGIRIHSDFEVHNVFGNRLELTVFFTDSNENPLRDNNNQYCSSAGEVASSTLGKIEIMPRFPQGDKFSDMAVFMPYSELHVSQPNSKRLRLKFGVALFNTEKKIKDGSSEILAGYAFEPFDLSW